MNLPAVFSSAYPPAVTNFRGAITMRLASGGADVDELVDEFTELAEDWAINFPDDAEPVAAEDVPGVVDEVVAAYQQVVTQMSPDAAGLMAALDALFEAGILYSYGDAFEAGDATEELQRAFEIIEADGGTLRGYLFSLVGDLDELVLEQRLDITFGVFDGGTDAATELATDAVRILNACGLSASWSGVLDEPIVVAPMVLDAPLVVEDEEHSH